MKDQFDVNTRDKKNELFNTRLNAQWTQRRLKATHKTAQ